jgi:hypothetical protein
LFPPAFTRRVGPRRPHTLARMTGEEKKEAQRPP